MRLSLICGMFVLGAFPSVAADYAVDYDASTITFSGTHAGDAFEGLFEDWNMQITFNPDDLSTSRIKARFTLDSAKTGNATYDGTLPQGDWFDVKNHPEGVFTSTAITTNDDGSYGAEGDLTLRGITQPVRFDFTLSDLDADPVMVAATFPIDRLAFDIGKKSDAKAEWVGQMITLTLAIQASRVEGAAE